MEEEIKIMEFIDTQVVSYKFKNNKRLFDGDIRGRLKSVYLIATRDLSNLWLQFFLSQNQGFMRLFEKTVLK